MTVLKTGISWAHSTWGVTVGCDPVSAGCWNCYAKCTVHRMGHDFSEIRTFPDRLKDAVKFTPVEAEDGSGLEPRKVFVNSLSDLMHHGVPDDFRDLVFDTMEATPWTVYQILSKRPLATADYLARRYGGGRPFPRNIWIGFSVEDARVKDRLRVLRRLKNEFGIRTVMVSVEPLIGPLDGCDFEGVDVLLIGGESRQEHPARLLQVRHLYQAIELGTAAGAAIYFKQYGELAANPLFGKAPHRRVIDKVRWMIDNGERLLWVEEKPDRSGWKVKGEKGGATLDGQIFRDMPADYAVMTRELRIGMQELGGFAALTVRSIDHADA